LGYTLGENQKGYLYIKLGEGKGQLAVTFVGGRVFVLEHCSKENLSPELLAKILEHLGVNDTLVDEMLAQSLDDLHLLFRGKASNGGLDDAAN
jgi:hypothetical protein